MFMHSNKNYRLIGNHLFERQNDAFIHVCVVPKNIKSLKKAIEWYQENRWGDQ